jgi:hypothetical protein
MLLQSWQPYERAAPMLEKKPSRKVKDLKTSRAAEAIKILNASIEDSYPEEMLRARKGARRKKASPTKRTSQR